MSIQTDSFTEQRIIDAAPTSPNEEAIERALRPKLLDEYVGQSKIRDQLEIENKMREEAFKLQKDLTEEQIKYLRNMNEQAARGDALIKVDGAGLQPHLEAFMWEILKTIQVRVNQQGLSMLLGV